MPAAVFTETNLGSSDPAVIIDQVRKSQRPVLVEQRAFRELHDFDVEMREAPLAIPEMEALIRAIVLPIHPEANVRSERILNKATWHIYIEACDSLEELKELILAKAGEVQAKYRVIRFKICPYLSAQPKLI